MLIFSGKIIQFLKIRSKIEILQWIYHKNSQSRTNNNLISEFKVSQILIAIN